MYRATLMSIVMAVVMTACASRVIVPPQPALVSPRAHMRNIDLYIRSFHISGIHPDDLDLVPQLRNRFLDYLEATTALTDIYLIEPDSTRPRLILDVKVDVEQTTFRTYLLDAVALVPPIFGLFSPWWGHVDITIEAELADGRGGTLAVLEHSDRVEFSALFYSWFRRGYVEDAYSTAYERAFAGVAEQLAQRAPELMAQITAPAGEDPALAVPDTQEPPAPETEPAPAVFGELAGQSGIASLDATTTRDFRLVTERPESGLDGTLYGYLKLLGGLEIAGVVGVARVDSSVETDGKRQNISRGNARQLGYRIALYDAPKVTGFFWYPTVGFLSQSIDIGDLRETLPQSTPDNATEIAAICSDPDSGQTLDCEASTTYELNIQSGYVGLRAGYNLLWRSEYVAFYLFAGGGVNLMEISSIEAKVGTYRDRQTTFNVLHSFAAGGGIGIAFPTLHIAIRFNADFEYYVRFPFKRPLEFRGPVTYDSERDAFVRPRVIVNDTRLMVGSFQLATAFIF